MSGNVVSATEFKAKCLAILDEVEKTGKRVTITKRGRPVVTLAPARARRFRSLKGALEGKVRIPDEILLADYSDLWECARGADDKEC